MSEAKQAYKIDQILHALRLFGALELRAALDNREVYSNRRLAAILSEAGFDVSASAVKRWRTTNHGSY